MSPNISPIEQLIHSTVRIECQTKDGEATGTGYFFGFFPRDKDCIPCLVTNKHVINGATQGKIYLTVKGDDGSPQLGKVVSVTFNGFGNMWIGHPDPAIDLAILTLGPVFQITKQNGFSFYFKYITREYLAEPELLSTLSTMEDIIMVGYPNGLWDKLHNLPIIRKGITATHPNLPYNGKPEFMIDAACFPGSSGSPVFLANFGTYIDNHGSFRVDSRVALLGTLYAGPQHTTTGDIVVVDVPTANTPVALLTIPNNLGLVIRADKLLDFEPILQKLEAEKIQGAAVTAATYGW